VLFRSLTGVQEAAKRIIGGRVRIGRPLGIQGLPEAAKSPAFAASVGLLVYPQVSGNEHYRPQSRPAPPLPEAVGYLGRVGRWLKSSF
jgi:cell division protein FtsA